MEVAIIDYGAGNVFSVATALERLGARVCITREEKTIRRADRVIFPGVGQAEAAMHRLAETGLKEVIPTLGQPVLGICLGMQLMCRHSEEGQVDGLGIFPLEVRRFPAGMEYALGASRPPFRGIARGGVDVFRPFVLRARKRPGGGLHLLRAALCGGTGA